MIRYLLFFLLIPLSLLHASKILSYNIYDRTDRADVMITFDTPYDGVIKQSITQSKIIIKLTNASIESSKSKKISSHFLHAITITPLAGETKIVASVPSTVRLVASKTSDSYGLRLRFVDKKVITHQQNGDTKEEKSTTSLSGLQTKPDMDLSKSYYIVIAILIVGILILFILKKKITTKNQESSTNKSNWLFKENQQKEIKSESTKKSSLETKNISIRFQKAIDENNSVVMLDFAEQSYLVLMGNGNILLDKFTDNKPTTQKDFESILQNRHQELENFLTTEPEVTRAEPFSLNLNSSKEALQAYKERAASMAYES